MEKLEKFNTESYKKVNFFLKSNTTASSLKYINNRFDRIFFNKYLGNQRTQNISKKKII